MTNAILNLIKIPGFREFTELEKHAFIEKEKMRLYQMSNKDRLRMLEELTATVTA